MTTAMHDKILAYKAEKGHYPDTVKVSPEQFEISLKDAIGINAIPVNTLFGYNYAIEKCEELKGEEMLFED